MLHDYLDRASRKPWRWGENDCCGFVADWALALTGKDPGEGIRGSYSSKGMADGILYGRGGIVRVGEACLEPCGWVRTDDPNEGAIGLVVAPTEDREVKLLPAIRFMGQWVLRARRGMVMGAFEHEHAWEWPGA
jgi:hypothetical protein